MLSSMETRRGGRAPPTRASISFLCYCVTPCFSDVTNKKIGTLLPLSDYHPLLPLNV